MLINQDAAKTDPTKCTSDSNSIDGLRAMCVDTPAATCPSSTLARQCIAARLNYAVSADRGGSCFNKGAPWALVLNALEQCCSPTSPLLYTSKQDECAKALATWNADKDFKDPPANTEGMPAGHTGDAKGLTSDVCKAYTEQWAAKVLGKETAACESGFCASAFIAPNADTASTTASITSIPDSINNMGA